MDDKFTTEEIERDFAAQFRDGETRRVLDDYARLISDWVWETDSNFRLTYVSPKITDSLGISTMEATGKRLSQLGVFRTSKGEPFDLDFSVPFQDVDFVGENKRGETRYLAVSGLPLFDVESGDLSGVRGISRDVTEPKRAETVLSQLAFAIENLSDMFFLHDPADRLVICNRRYREVNKVVAETTVPGTPFEEHLRAMVSKGLVPDAVGREDEWISYRMFLHRKPHGTFEATRHDGVVFEIHEERLPDGSTATFSRDVSHLKNIEHALRESIARNRSFTMNVAHELRTPLAVLRTNIDNLEDRNAAKSLNKDVDAISRLVGQLLDSVRIGELEMTGRHRTDLTRICRNVAVEMAPMAIKMKKDLELSAPDEPVWINGLEDPLEVAIRNIVENAIEHSPEGEAVLIKIVEDAPGVKIIDKGPGIPKGLRSLLIDSELRVDRRGGGHGFGLMIVGQVAKSHGATVEISDGNPGGTVFTLIFPREEGVPEL